MADTVWLMLFRLVGLFSFGFVSFAAFAGCTQGLTVAYSNWPPYHYADNTGEPVGLDIEILAHALSVIDCPYKLRLVPWKRALREIEHGTVDVGLAASKNAERERYAWFSVAYRREAMVMFMRQDEPVKYQLQSLSDLADTEYNVGLTLGIWYGESLSELLERKPDFQQRVLQKLENKSLFDWLIRGRVDVVVSDLFNGVFVARNEGLLDQVFVRPEVINDNTNHFIFSKATVSEQEVARINAAIAAFKNSTEYTSLLLKYVPKPYLLNAP